MKDANKVFPENGNSPGAISLYPVIPHSEDTPAPIMPSVSSPAPVPHRSTSPLPKLRSPIMARANINMAHMMNISSYIPDMKPPAFLKEVYTLPLYVGDQVNKEIVKVGTNINKLIDRSEVYLRKPPPMPEYTMCNIFSSIFSIFSYFFNMGTDIAAAYVLWDGHDTRWWFYLTVIIITVPTLIINSFSLYWYWHEDHECSTKIFSKHPVISKCLWFLRILFHCLLLGPVFRYLDILYYGIKSRQSKLQRVDIRGPYCPWPKQRKELKKQAKYYNLLLHEERDTSILELMQSFMQSAPQLVLQLYILAKRPESQSDTYEDYIITLLVQWSSSVTSLFSLSWSLTSYARALRYAMPEKPNLSVGAMASMFLWHSFMVSARVVCLALFATAFKSEVFMLLGSHWALMTFWILAQKTNFCGAENGRRRPCEELMYNIVIGWVYTFVMINVKNEATRYKYIFYYIIMIGENATIIAFWYLAPDSASLWYHLAALISTPVAFFVGLAFMLLYYRKYHPDGIMAMTNSSARIF